MVVEYTIDNFRTTFWTPFEQYAERIGYPFKVLGRDIEAESELAASGTPDVMYKIRFEDGTEISAWGEEVCKADNSKGICSICRREQTDGWHEHACE